MLRKNDIIELNITSLTSDGDGVGRAGELVFFVPNTAVGDVIDARVLKIKKNVGFAKVERIVTPSPDRIEPDCPVARSCGGCVYRHISYEAELNAKRQKVVDAVTRIGKLDGALVKDIIPSKNIDGYRNKAMIPIGLDRNGGVVMGFYARHSHNIMHCPRCRLSPEIFNEIAGDVYEFFRTRPELIYTPQIAPACAICICAMPKPPTGLWSALLSENAALTATASFMILLQKNTRVSQAL